MQRSLLKFSSSVSGGVLIQLGSKFLPAFFLAFDEAEEAISGFSEGR